MSSNELEISSAFTENKKNPIFNVGQLRLYSFCTIRMHNDTNFLFSCSRGNTIKYIHVEIKLICLLKLFAIERILMYYGIIWMKWPYNYSDYHISELNLISLVRKICNWLEITCLVPKEIHMIYFTKTRDEKNKKTSYRKYN